ncbi:ankyrin repeat containing protein [Metarhizium robertsii ARSEF 23]|uniref:Ankyrin repeat containing protein n=1 Tax=Metarhizium robertsii (strain ARSEF 23 / ATCC MYA-3075) TaxID=655844 RepID=E9EZH3_METRA|nr:ankyrin repeat containing protein [Metarhizium robertsii ARSEF 23]EFY99364.2 ankyrin repeat containing protein [Metarhizium robertsii ARSEF 23]
MELSYHQTTGPSLQLRTLRGVPDNAQCVNFALNGNIDGLKFLFRHGLASPRDYETCKFLIQAGADVDYKPLGAFDNSPRIKACHSLLEGNLSEFTVGALRGITNGSEYLDDFIVESSFTQTHRIILGLSIGDLERELISHPGEINTQDSMGRTALAWAAAQGDSHSILTLLRYGADPNIMDSQISGPLSNASAQGHTACVKLLLDAGANPDPPRPGGINKGGPLNVAARRSNDPILVKLLLDFGAEVDQFGVDGKTALCHAAQNNDASLAILLLEYGAEINKTTITGDTPLTIAITPNSHHVLRLFLERWHHYSIRPRLKGPHLLEITAKYGDLETIGILANTNHFRLKYDEKFTLSDFSKVIQERPNGADKLTLAFEELLSIFKHAPHAAEQQESLVEAGCWPCLASRSTTWETANESPQRSDDESDDQLHNTQALPEDDNRHTYIRGLRRKTLGARLDH